MKAWSIWHRGALTAATLTLWTMFIALASGQVPQEPPAVGVTAESAQPVNSAPAPDPAALKSGPQTIPGVEADFSYLNAIGGLGLVLCLIVAGFLAMRKFAPQYFAKKPAERNLKLVESLAMGDRRSIAVIEVDDRRFLVGGTSQQITLLASLPGNLALAPVSPPKRTASFEAAPAAGSNTTFRNLYEFEKGQTGLGMAGKIPPDLRAKMRQLRESLER